MSAGVKKHGICGGDKWRLRSGEIATVSGRDDATSTRFVWDGYGEDGRPLCWDSMGFEWSIRLPAPCDLVFLLERSGGPM